MPQATGAKRSYVATNPVSLTVTKVKTRRFQRYFMGNNNKMRGYWLYNLTVVIRTHFTFVCLNRARVAPRVEIYEQEPSSSRLLGRQEIPPLAFGPESSLF